MALITALFVGNNMKTYIKVLGLLSLLTILTAAGFLTAIAVKENGSDRIFAISLFIPLYFIFHFLVANKFGFSFNQEDSMSYRKLFIVSSIISFLITFILPMYLVKNEISKMIQERKYKQEFSEVIDWGNDTTFNSIYGNLKTKYYEDDFIYQVSIMSINNKHISLSDRFHIEFYDEDGFMLSFNNLIDYSYIREDRGRIIGITSNSRLYMSFEEYSKIKSWRLYLKDY